MTVFWTLCSHSRGDLQMCLKVIHDWSHHPPTMDERAAHWFLSLPGKLLATDGFWEKSSHCHPCVHTKIQTGSSGYVQIQLHRDDLVKLSVTQKKQASNQTNMSVRKRLVWRKKKLVGGRGKGLECTLYTCWIQGTIQWKILKNGKIFAVSSFPNTWIPLYLHVVYILYRVSGD